MDCGYHDLANKVVKENLKGTNLLMWNANIESHARNLDVAIQLMKKAVAEEPLRPAWRFTLGWYYLLDRQLQLAETELREALQLPGGDFADISDLAVMYIVLVARKEIDEAERLKNRALEEEGAYFWLSLAAHYAELENWDKTLEASQHALEAKPIFKEVLIYKARALVKLEDLSEGIQAYQELIGLQPRNGKAYLELSEAYAKVGELEKAISTLDIALSDSILSEPQKEEANRIRMNH
jgi:tetratricopeptide (TPR) repeat protein